MVFICKRNDEASSGVPFLTTFRGFQRRDDSSSLIPLPLPPSPPNGSAHQKFEASKMLRLWFWQRQRMWDWRHRGILLSACLKHIQLNINVKYHSPRCSSALKLCATTLTHTVGSVKVTQLILPADKHSRVVSNYISIICFMSFWLEILAW